MAKSNKSLADKAKSVPSKAERDLNSKNQKIVELNRQLKAQKILVNELQQVIDDFHRSRFQIPKQKKKKYLSKKCFRRIAFGDTHGSHLDLPAWNAVLRDLEILQPQEIIHGGDMIECGGWLAQHHTMSYVAETEYSFADDVIATNLMLDQLQNVCPTAKIMAVEGNHDARIEKWCVTTTLRHKADAEYLRQHFAPENVTHLKKRGIEWFRRSVRYRGCSIPGTIKLGSCYFTHPQSASKHQASRMVDKFGANVVFFHTHRRDSFTGTTVRDNAQFGAWNPGCLCKLQKYWRHTEPSGHTHGYHLQLVHPDGSFLPVNVPIIDGKSYLTDLIA